MKTYQITIGSNNATGQVEKEKAIKTVSKRFDGFSYHETIGYWKGKPENSAVFTIATDNPSMIQRVSVVLRDILLQECVMVTVIGESEFI